MKKRRYSRFAALCGLSLLIATIFLQPKIHAAEVWYDNFDDLNCDSWEVMDGTFSCANGYLESTEIPSGPTIPAIIYHQDNISTGWWSFDIKPSSSLMDILLGNNLYLSFSPSTFAVYRGTFDNRLFQWHPPQTVAGTWTHIDFTVDEVSNLDLFVNDSHIDRYTTLSISESGFFTFRSFEVGDAIDNIVVNDEIDYEALPFPTSLIPTTETTSPETTTTTESTTTTTPTEPTTVAFPIEFLAIGAIAVVIIVIVAFKVKRS
jgi:hypothetical protein